MVNPLLMARRGVIPVTGRPRDTGTAEFANNRLEWRRLVAEAGGTFLLVLVAAGAGVVNAVSHGQVGRTAAVTAPGLMVLALIYTIGATSGAHLNPAVTVGFAARGHFPWGRVPGYVLAQVCGATAAAALLRSMFGTAGRLGGTFPGHGIPAGTALVTEIVLSFGLMTVILGTSSGPRNVGHNAAVAIGGYVALAGLWASPVSGASMNPARSLGPALVSGDLGCVWIYLAGPAAGALLAVGLAWALRGHPSRAADIAAQGAAEDGAPAGGSLPVPTGIAVPADSLEMRWIAAGPVTPALREWFARFPVGAETRDDAYLLQPRLRRLAVKLRDGNAVDLKALLGTPKPVDLPGGGRGTLELWRKWSFSGDSYGAQANSDAPGTGWAVVRKKRFSTWFPLASDDAEKPGDDEAAETGCAVELTEIDIGTKRYVSVGLEARGAAGLLHAALEHAAGLVFAVALPPGSGLSFSLENSQSYAQWLARISGPVSSFPGRLAPDHARVVQRGPVARHPASQAAIRRLSSVQRVTRPVMVSRTARAKTPNPSATYAWPVTCESCSGGLVSWPSAVVHNCRIEPGVVSSGTMTSPVITLPSRAVHRACASGSPNALPCDSSVSTRAETW